MQQQPAGAREAGRETQQQPAPSYAALERAHAAARDCYTLLMLAAVQAATLISFIHGSAQPLSSLATLRRLPVPLFFGACLAWRLLAPRSWERWRSGTVVALRLTLAALLLQRAHQRVAAHAAHSGAGTSTQLASAVLVALGAPGLALLGVGMPLPPLLAAAVQAAATATLATANPGLCSTLLRRHPEHVATAYQWLQPAFAPLEPLLWGTGVDAEHPSRRCHCVLAAVQVWGGCVLPVLLTLSSNARSFRAYRRRRLEALLAAERRQLREEQRHWTRAAAAQRADQADALGIPHGELSSGSSGPPTPEAAAEAATVAAQAEALLEAPAPLGLLPPDDLPYEAAYQAWLHLGSLGGWGALPLSALLCLVYAWHVLAFG